MMQLVDTVNGKQNLMVSAPTVARAEEEELDPHIGVLLTNLQLNVEKMQEQEIRDQLAKVETLNSHIENITSLLEVLEVELADPKKTEIDLTAVAPLLDTVWNIFNPQQPGVEKPQWIKALERNQFTRAEAETLSKVLGRQIEQVARKVNLQTVELNQAVEKRHEVLQIARELLKMFREHMKTLTHNQRAGM
ncbi:MAG: hypothetical protein JSR58_07875 [Verrucomicrobia bacterium]|nr:hypothetical protein [Verrucomicrobiota bacterium]